MLDSGSHWYNLQTHFSIIRPQSQNLYQLMEYWLFIITLFQSEVNTYHTTNRYTPSQVTGAVASVSRPEPGTGSAVTPSPLPSSALCPSAGSAHCPGPWWQLPGSSGWLEGCLSDLWQNKANRHEITATCCHVHIVILRGFLLRKQHMKWTAVRKGYIFTFFKWTFIEYHHLSKYAEFKFISTHLLKTQPVLILCPSWPCHVQLTWKLWKRLLGYTNGTFFKWQLKGLRVVIPNISWT